MTAAEVTRIGILGTTSWATTLGLLLARQGHDAVMWARSVEEADLLNRDRENRRHMPGAEFPGNLTASASAAEVFSDAPLMLVVVPSVTMRKNAAAIAAAVPGNAVVLSATKGIEIETGRRMSELLAEELPQVDPAHIGVLSGPNLAPEIAAGMPGSATVAFAQHETARKFQSVLTSEVFRVYTSDDVTGVELGGALKNIIAIGAGIIDGLRLGDNAKAAFITRGLYEITRLGVAMGARLDTFAGLAGMGDLIASCYSDLARNHRLGRSLAGNLGLERALEDLGQVAEGVPTTQAAVKLAERHEVDMPITRATHRVLFDGLPPKDAISELMRRTPQPEVRLD